MSRKKSIKSVLVALPLSTASGRDFLAGFSRYAREHGHWHIRIHANPSDLTSAILKSAMDGGLNGLVMSENYAPAVARLIETSQLPVTLLGQRGTWIKHRKSNISFVRNNDNEIGRFAANYLLNLGRFRSFGFIPDWNESYWADERAQGFADQIRPTGIAVRIFKGRSRTYDETTRTQLLDWLDKLPKPAGIFAAADIIAAEFLSLCESESIDVPRSVSVISVDNDELICDFTTPPLSSILPDHEKLGELAAKELSRLMRSRNPTPAQQLFSTEKRLIERESSRAVIPAAQLVNRAIQYIRENITRNISTEDVIRHLGVSRRLADLRLRQFQNTTVAALISRMRLDEVTRWLRTSKASCAKIALSCGYDNPKHLANAFHRHYAMSMTDYRKKHSQKTTMGRR